jgi:heat shock protein beta-11
MTVEILTSIYVVGLRIEVFSKEEHIERGILLISLLFPFDFGYQCMYKSNLGTVASSTKNDWEVLKQHAIAQRDTQKKMTDSQIADGAPGCEASSPDWNPWHPPSSSIDSNPTAFWSSTGMYPADLVVSFGEHSTLRSIEIISVGIRRLEILKCESGATAAWDSLVIEDCDDADGGIQQLSPNIPYGEKAAHIKLRILSGYDSFVWVYKCGVVGSPTGEGLASPSGKGVGKYNQRDLAGPGSLSSRLGGPYKK